MPTLQTGIKWGTRCKSHMHAYSSNGVNITLFRHLKQHLESKIDVDGKEWDKEQQFFHYFQVSDLNRDSYIDGIEVSKAITHQHEEQARAWSDEEIESSTDPILKKMDADGDGFIDYTEYRLRVET